LVGRRALLEAMPAVSKSGGDMIENTSRATNAARGNVLPQQVRGWDTNVSGTPSGPFAAACDYLTALWQWDDVAGRNESAPLMRLASEQGWRRFPALRHLWSGGLRSGVGS